MKDEDIRTEHPSFGQISASRVNCRPAAVMYGSKLRHARYIMLSITQSESVRSINQDRYHPGKEIVRVRMSETQFAEFITSLNMGGGTPCTIERLQMKQVAEPPYVDETTTIRNEFKERTHEVASRLAAAQKKLADLTAPGAKISKAELKELQSEIEFAIREIGANMPYVTECFEETIAETVTAAKIDIEAYASDRFARAGLAPGTASPVSFIEAPKPYICDICGKDDCDLHLGEGWQ